MKKRVIAAILAGLMAVSTLAGCGSGKSASETNGQTSESGKEEGSGVITDKFKDIDTDGTTITFWHSMGGVNGEAMDYLVNKFNEENEDGITVEAVYQENMTMPSISSKVLRLEIWEQILCRFMILEPGL